jgi:hypothetical protein
MRTAASTPAMGSAPARGRTAALPMRLMRELYRREPVLAGLGFALFAAVPPLALACILDPRLLDGVGVWVKPIKFLVSVGLFALTSAWFFGYLPEARRRAAPMRAAVRTLVATACFEIAYITAQGALGQASHFNETTAFHAVMYALMGIAALLLVGTALPLGREIARHAAGLHPAFRLSLVLGLVLTFVLGAGTGIATSLNGGHGIGGLAGDPGLPFFGWSTTGGDLRPVHFLGIHAQQILPLAGALAVRTMPERARATVWVVAAVYVLLTLAVFLQALAGRPFLPL